MPNSCNCGAGKWHLLRYLHEWLPGIRLLVHSPMRFDPEPVITSAAYMMYGLTPTSAVALAMSEPCPKHQGNHEGLVARSVPVNISPARLRICVNCDADPNNSWTGYLIHITGPGTFSSFNSDSDCNLESASPYMFSTFLVSLHKFVIHYASASKSANMKEKVLTWLRFLVSHPVY